MDPTFMDVIKFCAKHIIEIFCFLSLFVEISPIKINPISWLLNLINKPVREDIAVMKEEFKEEINNIKKELKEDIEKMQESQILQDERIEELVKTNEMSEISRLRWDIIVFSNSLDNGQKHNRDEYRHIKDEYIRIKSLIDKYEMNDIQLEEEIEKVNKHYNEHKTEALIYF